MAAKEPTINVSAPTPSDDDSLALETEEIHETQDTSDEPPTRKRSRVNICCSWWWSMIWILLQFIFAVACMAGAVKWRHSSGVAIGFFSFLCMLVYAVIYRKQFKYCKNRVCGAEDPSIDEAPQGRARTCLNYMCVFIFLFVSIFTFFFSFLFAIVFWGFPDPTWTTLPVACPDGHNVDCVHIGPNVTGITLAHPPTFNTSRAAILDSTQNWLNGLGYQRATTITYLPDTGFMHARIITEYYGFPDDFSVYVFCSNATSIFEGNSTPIFEMNHSYATVWIHSQSRTSDPHTALVAHNKAYVENYLQFLNNSATSNNWTSGHCV